MYRETDSYLVPLEINETKNGVYDVYPAFKIKDTIFKDIKAIVNGLKSHKYIVIDGYEGVLWDLFIATLKEAFDKSGKSLNIINIEDYLKPEEEINDMIKPYMGTDNSIFGLMTDLNLEDFFDIDAVNNIECNSDCDINIVYGCGASLVNWDAKLVYVDLPKNELQFRMAAGKSFNLGCTVRLDSRDSYKRCYFIDWPILDAYKGLLIPKIDWIVDEQRIDSYTYMSGDALRSALESMCHNAFRVRPWFAPGIWGGTYLRDHLEGLNRDVKNLAWSFELMALENGIMFQHDSVIMEISFSFLMSYGYKKILGHCAEDFKEDFPIRFDFLDTINGGNLSIQCHPRPEYIRSEFGKKYTQDETYYILNATPDATVYLGFQDDINKEEFKAAIEGSQSTGNAIEIEKYVKTFNANKHELYLIPNGTIHASGSGNLVLEISSAPYIFTFKMYDWVRLDTDGRPRPINIDHGMNNVRFERKGDLVDQTLISKSYVLEQNDDIVLEHLPTHPDHFYDVHRYKIASLKSVVIDTNDKCHVWMIVEGQSVLVTMKDGVEQGYNYLETFIIPAASESYTIYNESNEDVLLVKAFVKDTYKL